MEKEQTMTASEGLSCTRLSQITEDDVPRIIELWADAGLPTKPGGRDTVESLTRQRRASPDLFIGAFEGDRMIGVVVGSDDGRKGWVNRLAVVPDRRRSGIAIRLLNECETALRKRGRQIICALIEDDNEISKCLFETNGYKREDLIIYYSKRDAEDV